MKKHTLYSLWLLAPIALWAQMETSPPEESMVTSPPEESMVTPPVEASAPEEVDLSDVIVVEDTAASDEYELDDTTTEVVEIPDAPVEGASIDEEAPVIPEVTESMPTDTEIVLEIPGSEASAPGEASMETEETISVDFPDEDVRTILRNVANLFDLNLVIPDTLQGRTSIQLRNITWQQVFEVVLEPLGFTYVEDRNIIRIKSIEELTTEPVDTRVFVVNYARAQDLQNSISPLINTAAGGRIQVDTRSNALVITERPSHMNKIQEIIERLDKATSQVMIESKFVEVTKNDVKNIGVNWASLQNYEVSTGPFSENRVETETDTSSSGSDLSVSSGTAPYAETLTITDTMSNLVTETTTTNTAVFSADQFRLVLSALKTANDVKLVANPTVVTLDNSLATIDIAEFFPNPQFTFNAETGQRQLNGVDLEEDGIKVGITLAVTPQVNSAGFINLKVQPTVSRSDRTVTIEGSEFPIIDKRTTQTTVTIKDGFTLAIGGLVENSTSNQVTKVPVLGDLPGVGRLFRNNNDVESQRNLIIFITAKTLNPDGTTYKDVIDPRVIDEIGLTDRDVPGYDLTRNELERLQQLRTYREENIQAERLEELDNRIRMIEYIRQQEAKKDADDRN